MDDNAEHPVLCVRVPFVGTVEERKLPLEVDTALGSVVDPAQWADWARRVNSFLDTMRHEDAERKSRYHKAGFALLVVGMGFFIGLVVQFEDPSLALYWGLLCIAAAFALTTSSMNAVSSLRKQVLGVFEEARLSGVSRVELGPENNPRAASFSIDNCLRHVELVLDPSTEPLSSDMTPNVTPESRDTSTATVSSVASVVLDPPPAYEEDEEAPAKGMEEGAGDDAVAVQEVQPEVDTLSIPMLTEIPL